MMNNKQIAEQLLALLGGKENIKKVECCMTRVRVELQDGTKAEEQKIRGIEGVFGILGKANDMQIVFGPGDAQEIVQYMEKILSN